ncbi:hypothetical protein [Halococcus hamelinensis]|uniref:Uncharacterized protein n=1 Tax=Halococcus hamelinensis 100A6 TaxID=1132509 RepID=M0M6H7_9EURY|nr:hypothetical protein [Halococcus hamelinensis]EMA41417.1 hypothetical protein C447_01145 [Halococcus hamelinensis 100A6]
MSDTGPATTMRERTGDSRVRLWVLLTANRALVAGLLTLGLFVVLVAVGVVNVYPLRTTVRNGTHIERLFQAFIMSIITGITLVVTLNQLVLSRELGPLGEKRDEMADATEFRQHIEELTGSVAPPEPASFMRTFMQLSTDRADGLKEAVADDADAELRDSVNALGDRIRTQADDIGGQLSEAEFGEFEVIPAILNYDYSWKIYTARRLRSEHSESLSEDERTAFDELIQALSLFAPAREHFKTLYFRRELVDFSRKMLYAGVPALAISILGLVYLDPNSFVGSTLGMANLVFAISAAVAIASMPFFVLVSYILRLGTIAQRTLAVGPFILRDSQRSDDIGTGEDQ